MRKPARQPLHPYNRIMRRCLSFRFRTLLTAVLVLIAAAKTSRADAPPFDLIGPKVDVRVQRNGVTLPIAQVPNLMPGDRLWVHPDLPESQSNHYILIVVFLRGATNSPPPDWYTRVETWNHQVREEGVFVVVPKEAEQALIFLAPETGGDFTTLRKAVHDRPGAFVRAGQDLQQASWDRMRLDDYLDHVKNLPQGDPKILKEKTELLGATLGIRVDQQCFDKPTEQQAPCLTQHPEGLVLDDSNAQSIVNQMVNGSAADMMNQLSYAPLAGAGVLSPYVGAVVDMARILSTLHTARYQYIPALALPQKTQPDTLNLRLNVPPSFRDPKSVIVVALPPVGPPHTPQLHPEEEAGAQASASNASPTYCATKPDVVFSAQGAPLVYATAMAHDMVLHIETKAKQPTLAEDHSEIKPEIRPESKLENKPEAKTGIKAGIKAWIKPAGKEAGSEPKPDTGAVAASKPAQAGSGIDIPVRPRTSQGGFVLEQPLPELPEREVVAELRGKWGFDDWEGPKFHLRQPHPGGWVVPVSDLNALITDRDDTLHIHGESTLCVEDVEAILPEAHSGESAAIKLAWKSPKPELLDVTVPLKDASPGTVTIAIHQYGMAKPENLPLKAYAEAAAIEHLSLSAGDTVAVLKGRRLDEVESADLAGITFAPAVLNRVQNYDQLQLSATGVTSTLRPGSDYSAKVTLRDGRTLHVPATVGAPRPQVELLSKGVQQDAAGIDPAAQAPVHLGSPDDLPLQRKLVFFLRSRMPAVFPRNEKIELAAVDGSFGTTLSLADSSLMLEDTHTAVAVLDPYARFGASAFGPIQLRAVTADGVTGDWVQLGKLVRLPGFSGAPGSKELRCPRSPSKPCQLTGNNLFLITQVATDPDMSDAVDVPEEFTGSALTVPNIPRSGVNGGTGTLYMRLRDDPDTVQTLNLPITAVTPGAIPAASDSANAPAQPAKPEASTPVLSSDPPGNAPKSAAKTDTAAGPGSVQTPN
jgi:hypothetical protein